jgi:predicted DNA-binding transcriptional regulator AlpA
VNDTTPSLRILRSHEVDRLTGTHPSQRVRLEAEGKFPMRVKITNKSVGWIEGEVLAWMAMRDEVASYEDNLPPGARYRLRLQRQREPAERFAEAEHKVDEALESLDRLGDTLSNGAVS